MRHTLRKVAILSVVSLACGATETLAGRGGFGGGRGGGGGFRGGGGVQSFGGNRGGGGQNFGGRAPTPGAYGGSYNSGARSGTYNTQRGGTINYGAAGRSGTGPGGTTAGRGVYGVQGTTAGGKSYGDVGRVGGVQGPGGNSAGYRSNAGYVQGQNGTVAGGSRSGFAQGQNGAIGGSSRAGFAEGPNGVVAGGSRAGFAEGPNGAVAGRSYGAAGVGRSGFGAAGGWGYGYASGGNAWGYRNPSYAAYNSGWVHGYSPYGYAGLGLGVAAVGLGSSLYSGGWGYMPYQNPYQTMAVAANGGQTAGYDYAQPIDTGGPAPAQAVAQDAATTFDQARDAFKAGDYAAALDLTDKAIAGTPDNADLHQFRALALIALTRYDEAAAVLHGVLSVGPGWDWTTVSGFYPDIDTYTAQLRAAEAYARKNPRSAPAAFVLGYLYLAEGHNDTAAKEFRYIATLQPDDLLSARILQSLTAKPAAAPPDAPAGSLAGTWNASPGKGSTILLKIADDGKFSWTSTQDGRATEIVGQSTYGEGVLTLVSKEGGPPMVGQVKAPTPEGFLFQAMGGGPGDPGLAFRRSR